MTTVLLNNVANEKEKIINIASETNKIEKKAANRLNWWNKQGKFTIMFCHCSNQRSVREHEKFAI